MYRFIILGTFITIILYSCSQEKIIRLKGKGNIKITYSASKKYGYSMDILKPFDGQYMQYAVRLNQNGEVMYVYKTLVSFLEKDSGEPKVAGPTWYLVSDTTDTLVGAKILNRDILGYYNSQAVNFIISNDYKGKSLQYLEAEKMMFIEVANLMKSKKKVIISFDTTHHFFWFKYDTQ